AISLRDTSDELETLFSAEFLWVLNVSLEAAIGARARKKRVDVATRKRIRLPFAIYSKEYFRDLGVMTLARSTSVNALSILTSVNTLTIRARIYPTCPVGKHASTLPPSVLLRSKLRYHATSGEKYIS